METRKLIARKALAFVALIAVAAAVFIIAPPAIRLIVALLALPIETLIVSSLFGGSGRQIPHSFQPGRHSLAD